MVFVDVDVVLVVVSPSLWTRWHLMMVMSSTMTCHILMWLYHQFITKKCYSISFFPLYISNQQQPHQPKWVHPLSTNTIMMWWFVISFHCMNLPLFVLMGQKFFFSKKKERICSFRLLELFVPTNHRVLALFLYFELVNLSHCILFNQITIKIKITQPNNSPPHIFSERSKWNLMA